MKTLLYSTFLIQLLGACNSYDEGHAQISSDTLTIRHKCAVYYKPDSIFTEKLKVELGEAEFNQAADDYSHFIEKASKYLSLVNLKIVDAKENDFLRFVYKDRSQYIIEPKTLPDPWGIIFFDEDKIPKPVDVSIIEMEYNNYF